MPSGAPNNFLQERQTRENGCASNCSRAASSLFASNFHKLTTIADTGTETIHHVATNRPNARARHVGIKGPENFAGLCVQRVRNAPLARCVDYAIRDLMVFA